MDVPFAVGSGWINGERNQRVSYNLPFKWGMNWGYNPLNIDPNLLGHPSTAKFLAYIKTMTFVCFWEEDGN